MDGCSFGIGVGWRRRLSKMIIHGIKMTWSNRKNVSPEFGVTYCGKDFVVKEVMKGYTKDESKVTCKNCLKSLKGIEE
jgi:hypothetical protein